MLSDQDKQRLKEIEKKAELIMPGADAWMSGLEVKFLLELVRRQEEENTRANNDADKWADKYLESESRLKAYEKVVEMAKNMGHRDNCSVYHGLRPASCDYELGQALAEFEKENK